MYLCLGAVRRRRSPDGIIASFDYHYRYRIIGSGHPMRFCPKNMNIISLNKLTLISLECDKQIMPRVCFFFCRERGRVRLSVPPQTHWQMDTCFLGFSVFFLFLVENNPLMQHQHWYGWIHQQCVLGLYIPIMSSHMMAHIYFFWYNFGGYKESL